MHEIEIAMDTIFYGAEGDFVENKNISLCVTRCNSGLERVNPICLIRYKDYAFVETRRSLISDWVKLAAGSQDLKVFKLGESIIIPAKDSDEAKYKYEYLQNNS